MTHAVIELNRDIPDQVRVIMAALSGVSVTVADGRNRLAVGDHLSANASGRVPPPARQDNRPDAGSTIGRRTEVVSLSRTAPIIKHNMGPKLSAMALIAGAVISKRRPGPRA